MHCIRIRCRRIVIERHRVVLIERSCSVVWKFYIHHDNGVNSEVVGFAILCYGYTRGGGKSIFEYHRHRIIMYNTTYYRGLLRFGKSPMKLTYTCHTSLCIRSTYYYYIIILCWVPTYEPLIHIIIINLAYMSIDVIARYCYSLIEIVICGYNYFEFKKKKYN